MPTNYHNPRHKNSTLTTRLACALLFLLFTFFWLYWFQADMLAVAQHGLSGGKTHYNRTVGALIVTGVLLVLQFIVNAIIRLQRRTHALTYLPSFMLLAFVSGQSSPFTWGAWLWAGPLVLLVWVGLVVLSKKMLPFENDEKEYTGLFSRRVWVNLLQMTAMMLGVVAVNNTNAVDHYKARAEVALVHGDVDRALRAGEFSHETDESLTMLRAFALTQKGELADRLFCYPVAGSSADLLPLAGSKSQLKLLADSIIWDHFGLRPDSLVPFGSKVLSTVQYLDSLEHDSLASFAYIDYRLMSLLVDRRLHSFVVSLPRHYVAEADSLPVHYREALVLYQQRFDTLFIYDDSLMLERWNDYRSYDSIYPLPSERKLRAEDLYMGTYWYYYDK